MATMVDVMLTLPDLAGWYDRLLIYGTPHDCRVYAGSFHIQGRPVTEAHLQLTQQRQEKSRDPYDIAGRKEMQARIGNRVVPGKH